MDGIAMEIEPEIALPEPVRPHRKRESGYARMKRRALIAEAQKARSDDLAKDITALEGIVDRLLNHLDRAARIEMTDQDRNRLLRMVHDMRGHLAKE